MLMLVSYAEPVDSLTPETNYKIIAQRLARNIASQHLSRQPPDDTISARAWTNFLVSLDTERLFFLQSDIDNFSSEKYQLDDHIKEGNIIFAYLVFNQFRKRVKETLNYITEHVTNRLEHHIKLKKGETYKWNRQNTDWPQDENEKQELWNKKIINEVAVLRASTTNNITNETKIIISKYNRLASVLEEVDAEWVLEKYLSAFAEAYDPHSTYLSPNTIEDFAIEMNQSLVGIGAILTSEDGVVKVVSTIPGGPAHRDTRPQRLVPGDKIIAVAQEKEAPVDIMHMPLYKVVRLIRGKKGTKIILTVQPASDPSGSTTKIVDLIRDEVKLDENTVKLKLEEKTDFTGAKRTVGIITLSAFYGDVFWGYRTDESKRSCAEELKSLLLKASEKKAEGVLLDLRNNSGGSLEEAVRVTGLFIGSGPVVQVLDRTRLWGRYRLTPLMDPDPSIVYAGPLVVLINRLSASAAEIVAGALQDYGRAVIVGDSKTFGKGTVQALIKLGNNMGFLKVTTTKYYRISGMSTQLKGVTSDILIPSVFDYSGIGEDSLPNALPWSVTNSVPYVRWGELNRLIPLLRIKSEERRMASLNFAQYEKQLEYFHKMWQTGELPLDIAERRKLIETEKQLSMSPVHHNEIENIPDKQKDKDDIILHEALNILLDLIEMQAVPNMPQGHLSDRTPRKKWLEFLKWFNF